MGQESGSGLAEWSWLVQGHSQDVSYGSGQTKASLDRRIHFQVVHSLPGKWVLAAGRNTQVLLSTCTCLWSCLSILTTWWLASNTAKVCKVQATCLLWSSFKRHRHLFCSILLHTVGGVYAWTWIPEGRQALLGAILGANCTIII